jgi:hypothetical protein
MVEDLVKDLVLNEVELFERGLNSGSVVFGGEMQRLCEAKRGVMHQHLGVLEAFRVLLEIHLDEMSVSINLLERCACLIVVAVDHLLDSDLGHCVDELGVKITLIARVRLLRAQLELAERLRIRSGFVNRSVYSRSEEKEGC